jgi:hypothetical protein
MSSDGYAAGALKQCGCPPDSREARLISFRFHVSVRRSSHLPTTGLLTQKQIFEGQGRTAAAKISAETEAFGTQDLQHKNQRRKLPDGPFAVLLHVPDNVSQSLCYVHRLLRTMGRYRSFGLDCRIEVIGCEYMSTPAPTFSIHDSKPGCALRSRRYSSGRVVSIADYGESILCACASTRVRCTAGRATDRLNVVGKATISSS